MDLIFTIGGLMLVWSFLSYMRRDDRLARKLTKSIPMHLYSFEVPYDKTVALSELTHYARKHHFKHLPIKNPTADTLLLSPANSQELRFPIYIRQIEDCCCRIDVGAVNLNTTPYPIFQRKHRQVAEALGKHLEKSWDRQSRLA